MAMTFKDIIAEMMGGASLGFSDEVQGVMDGITSKINGVNAGTPKGVMDTANPTAEVPMTADPMINVMPTKDYDFEVDGNTEGYTFTGDAVPNLEAIQNMRDMQGITADGLPNTTNLGLGKSIGQAAETNFLENSFVGKPTMGGGATHTMPDGTVMPGATHNANAQSEMGGMSMAAGQGGVDRATFNSNFANLTDAQKASVAEMMAGMTPAQKEMFARGMTTSGKLGGYEVGEQNRLAY